MTSPTPHLESIFREQGSREALFANSFVEHRVGDWRIVRLPWESITRLTNDRLPQLRILHPWPRADLVQRG